MVTSVSCFAVSFALIQWSDTPGSVIASWRLVGSALIWWMLLIGGKARTGRPLPDRAIWRSSLPAALAFGLFISILFTAVTKTSVGNTQFIIALTPVLAVPVGYFMFGERPNWRALRWGGLSLVGITIVLFAGPTNGTANIEGDLLMIIVLIVSALFLSLSKWARMRGVETADFMAIVMPVALITALPVALAVAGDEIWPLSGRAWFTVAVLSILTGGVAHGLLFYAHRSVPIGTISTIQVGQPALAVFWAWLIVGEQITAVQVPGMVLVMVGMGLVLWFSHQAAPVAARAASVEAVDGDGRSNDI